MAKVAIWLDDTRDPAYHRNQDRIEAVLGGQLPDQVIWVKTQEDFQKTFLRIINSDDLLVGVFFDNDLGPRDECGEGYDAFCWMENFLRSNDRTEMFELDAQTANPVAKMKLHQGFRALQSWWGQKGFTFGR